MLQNINIQKLVDEISQPNVVCEIDNEIPKNAEGRYIHIIYTLVNIVRPCMYKKLFNPYIHIKDIHGKLLFNDRLHIADTAINEIAIKNARYFDVHLVRRKDSLMVHYCVVTPELIAQNRPYVNRINFTDGVFKEVAYRKAASIIIKMIKDKEKMDHNSSENFSITVHNYEPETQKWCIENFIT
ncbi:hypothetical protein [Aquimarina sp. I32.4]|uniref:hypothetical protein n=1 Tax=Aquimarina sp. I32.4 TaxID=2053903 RepID=UPI000CDE8903|nr:hypothetical protein [Aquimarina sp. I32.4]